MTRREVFFFGAIGGIVPILVSILTIDFAPIIDHPESLTLGNYVGYGRGLSDFSLPVASSPFSTLGQDIRSRWSNFASRRRRFCTSYINAASPAARPQSALAPFAIVSVANAAEISSQAGIRFADGGFSAVLKDIRAGVGTRLDAVEPGQQQPRKFLRDITGKSSLPGPAAQIGSSCSIGGQTGLVTN